MADLHTTAYGEAGPRIVFLHGLFGQGRNWTQIAKALADDHRTVLVDLPHHGRSAWETEFDYIAMANRVAELLADLVDEQQGTPTTVVGHSMGGKVAMLAALLRPEAVGRLCVVDMAPVRYQHTHVFEGFVEAMGELDLASLESRGAADEQLATRIEDPAIRGFLLQNLRRDGDGWRWQMNLDVLGSSLDRLADWPEERLDGAAPYSGPVLWVAGQESNYIRPEYDDAMARWFPRKRLVTIKGAGHWVHSEQPEVFVEVLRRFVD